MERALSAPRRYLSTQRMSKRTPTSERTTKAIAREIEKVYDRQLWKEINAEWISHAKELFANDADDDNDAQGRLSDK